MRKIISSVLVVVGMLFGRLGSLPSWPESGVLCSRLEGRNIAAEDDDRQEAEQKIQRAQAAIARAQAAIERARQAGADVRAAEAKLEQAQAKLAAARAAFEAGQYEKAAEEAEEAEELAEEAEELAQDAEEDLSDRHRAVEALQEAEQAIARAQAAIERARQAGADVRAAEAKLEQAQAKLAAARAAFDQSEFQRARELAREAEELAEEARELAEGEDSRDSVEDEVVFEATTPAQVETIAARYGLTVLERIEGTGIARARIPQGANVGQILASLRTDPDVVQSEPNFLLQTPEVAQKTVIFIDQKTVIFIDGSSPAAYFDQSAGARIGLAAAHRIARGAGVTVAVIDTGVDRTHPALRHRLAPGMFDFIEGDADPSEAAGGPGFGHGTFVAGIVALVAPEAKILPLRAFTAEGVSTSFTVARAIRYALAQGAQVLNLSFGMLGFSRLIDGALEEARARGVIAVASAGNDGQEVPHYPASDESVLAVAATDAADRKANFSNYGRHVDLSAPGVGVYSAYPGALFGWASGTSFAAAFVSGSAALVLSALPASVRARSRSQVIRILQDSASDIRGVNPRPYWGKLGSGRLHVGNALALLAR
ncbi:Thermophilic serine proteinase [bacterium HR10]|nr:Thermophilic serine proteinase [bacterium HR10]